MFENHNVKVTVLSSKCPKYKEGDEINFNGAFIDKENSAELCMVALQAIYPFIYAFRRGGKRKEGPYQCTDCEETVVFKIEQND